MSLMVLNHTIFMYYKFLYCIQIIPYGTLSYQIKPYPTLTCLRSLLTTEQIRPGKKIISDCQTEWKEFFFLVIFFFNSMEGRDRQRWTDGLSEKNMEIKNGTKNRKKKRKKQVVVTSSLNLQRQNCLDFFFWNMFFGQKDKLGYKKVFSASKSIFFNRKGVVQMTRIKKATKNGSTRNMKIDWFQRDK